MNYMADVKDTAELENEIESIRSEDAFKSYLSRNQNDMRPVSLPEYLDKLLVQKGLTKAEVIERSRLDAAYAYHIFSGRKHPGREKILALAIAMGLNIVETQFLLRCAGAKQLYVRDRWDSVIFYALTKKMKVMAVNLMLEELGENTFLR